MGGSEDTRGKYFDLLELREAYKRGENITKLMREKLGVDKNTSEIIETAYDLQSGSYVDYANTNPDGLNVYAAEVAGILDEHLQSGDVLVDIGTGEMTTLCAVLAKLDSLPEQTLAFDISWSRIFTARNYVNQIHTDLGKNIVSFVADMKQIPLRDNSVDVVTSSHALEPNGGCLPELLTELFRITRRKLVLFEPSYELGSDVARSRMDRLGYIKNIEGVVNDLGGRVIQCNLLENIARVENPTACFVIEPSEVEYHHEDNASSELLKFSVPGTDYALTFKGDCYHSAETGLGFPVISSIPVLKQENAVLMTAL